MYHSRLFVERFELGGPEQVRVRLALREVQLVCEQLRLPLRLSQRLLNALEALLQQSTLLFARP